MLRHPSALDAGRRGESGLRTRSGRAISRAEANVVRDVVAGRPRLAAGSRWARLRLLPDPPNLAQVPGLRGPARERAYSSADHGAQQLLAPQRWPRPPAALCNCVVTLLFTSIRFMSYALNWSFIPQVAELTH